MKSWDPLAPSPAPGPLSFPKGGRGVSPAEELPSYLLAKAMLSCFVRNVQFLWQNKPGNLHAVQAKLKVFKCGESCLLDGKRDNMNMYKVPPASSSVSGRTRPHLGCMGAPSTARRGSQRREKFYWRAGGCEAQHTLLPVGRA